MPTMGKTACPMPQTPLWLALQHALERGYKNTMEESLDAHFYQEEGLSYILICDPGCEEGSCLPPAPTVRIAVWARRLLHHNCRHGGSVEGRTPAIRLAMEAEMVLSLRLLHEEGNDSDESVGHNCNGTWTVLHICGPGGMGEPCDPLPILEAIGACKPLLSQQTVKWFVLLLLRNFVPQELVSLVLESLQMQMWVVVFPGCLCLLDNMVGRRF